MAKIPILYHGTRLAHARAIVGPPPTVDVTRGGGEFGRGFYLGESKGMALRFAFHRSKDPAVVQVELPDETYERLSVRELDHANSNRLRLEAARSKTTYLVGVDIVVGTIENEPRKMQHKFESEAAQTQLNAAATLTVIT
ncbi:DUF3990 domain-containing protein [Sorangium sp. So ce315]|uniref:DUF3990 domain-containing protein n=1 Tax=Sorangium sp. So ce315 TaxID=3133299 RepID=UPI003F646022